MKTDTSEAPTHVIACGVLATDISQLVKKRGIEATLEFLPGGLHERPQELRRQLQDRIDRASAASRVGRVVVGYGVCGLGAVGLVARNVQLAIPRVNDCITLFLGSDAAYQEQFSRFPGTYYVSSGWVDEKAHPQSSDGSPIHCGADCFTFEELVHQYGEENAGAIRDFLNQWQRNYQRAAYIETGVSRRSRHYADLAAAMAEEFGWKYEELEGSHDLLAELLTSACTTDRVLVVPPHHVTAHDPVNKILQAVPIWEAENSTKPEDFTMILEETPAGDATDVSEVRLGLGIDAGGTYTDVVLHDFDRDEILAKAKSHTTKWDFSVGIGRALDSLATGCDLHVDLIAISTTLATNAIIEARGQKVGLLIFPPYGLFEPSDIRHRPLGILKGEMEIDGQEREPVDVEGVRREARKMLENDRVGAFAVSGFASHVNPSHERHVKEILEAETGLTVTCAHELSQQANYRDRSVTAALNAAIVPVLDSFLRDVDRVLSERGLRAPRMVVRSDGSLMSLKVALLRPIETILSGPAASVAGASSLAQLEDAMVVDMGGTTTDTAMIRHGVPRTSQKGASVGGWSTHVPALDLRTLGLGGDSLIGWSRDHDLAIGPLRVAPVSWALRGSGGHHPALDWLEDKLDRFRRSTDGMTLLFASAEHRRENLTDPERRVLDALSNGPCCLDQLAQRLDSFHWRFLPIESLEQRGLVFRSALTPTDLLQATNRVELWDAAVAKRLCPLFCRVIGQSFDELAEFVHQEVVRRLATELLWKQVSETVDEEELDGSRTTAALIDNWLGKSADDYRVRIALKYPIVGIGAPTYLYLPDAAELLETKAVIPENADVANAIGAINSRVVVQKKVEIMPSDDGVFRLAGLPGAPVFEVFADAYESAAAELPALVRRQAAEAGTSETRVEVRVRDRLAPVAPGGMVFIGRTLTARLSGRPDIARLV